MTTARDIDGLLRGLVPQVLGTLVHRYGDFDSCEDATQEALLAAASSGPRRVFPTIPGAGCSPWPHVG
ncbi:putative RNA polymerase sigma factor [Streptomyces collinus]